MTQFLTTQSKACSPRIDWTRLGHMVAAALGAPLVLVVLCLLLHNPITHAEGGTTTRYVAPSGEDSGSCSSPADPCRTVQYAISQAASGDEIRVAGGHYTGSITIGKDLTLQGGLTTTNWVVPNPDQNQSIIDAQGTGRVVRVNVDTATVEIRGFDLRGGVATGSYGGGIWTIGHLELENSKVHDNDAAYGGGIYIHNEASLVLKDSRVFSNSAEQQGGNLFNHGTATIESCEIFSGSAGVAGAIFIDFNSVVTSINNAFYANTSDHTGGAIYIHGGGSNLRIWNDTYYNNQAGQHGGAIYAGNCTIALTNTLIISNTANDGEGGGICHDAEELIISHSDFFGNFPPGIEGSPTISVGNRTTNPQFVDPQNHDLRLSPGSPAIDSGAPSPVALSDVDGHGRPFGSAIDRGADEYTPLSSCYARVGQALIPTDTHRVYTAVQPAVDAAASDSLVKVAGRCAGVEARGGLNQTVYLSKSLTLRGAYTATDWTSPRYGPTVLDGEGLGRVLYITGTSGTAPITPVIENFHLTGGQSDYGAGVYVGQSVSATLQDNVMFCNQAVQNGGGIYNEGAHLKLNANHIYSGTAELGGGIYQAGGTLTMTNNLLHNNVVITDGGAIYAQAGPVTLLNNTFHANGAGRSGGAVYASGDSTLVVTNTIVANNDNSIGGALDGAPQTVSLAYNLFHHNAVSNTGGAMPAPSTPSDVLADPLFMDPNADPPDLHLKEGSPAQDAGDPVPYPERPLWDYDNNPRINGCCVDIGAYELLVPPQPLTGIVLTGPVSTTQNVIVTLTASVIPITAARPITYSWSATEHLPGSRLRYELSDTIDVTWPTTGTKTITVTAVNCGDPVSTTHTVTVTQEQIPPKSAVIHGPATGITDTAYAFTATVSPPTTTQPITLAWQATGQEPLTRTDSVSFTWPAMGRQTITMTASNVAGAVVATHTITICYWADLNCDGRVDVGDISDIAAHWRDQEGDPGYRPRYDPDGDHIVTVVDIMRIASQWDWSGQQARANPPGRWRWLRWASRLLASRLQTYRARGEAK